MQSKQQRDKNLQNWTQSQRQYIHVMENRRKSMEGEKIFQIIIAEKVPHTHINVLKLGEPQKG